MPILRDADLARFSSELFRACGVSESDAKLVADSLVESNLRGHDSHGVMRIPFYIGKVQDGTLKPNARLVIEKESASSLACDGGWGFGQVLAQDLMSRLMTKCETSAIVCGTIRRACHIGRLGEYAEMATAKGLSAMVIANNHGAAQRVAPVGGKRPRLGTNPICIGVPGGAKGPFVFDIGTSATAEGKVRVKKIAGQTVPLGWILDPDGKPTTDPNQLYGTPPGTILPLGGDQAYKGFGLAFMIEMLAGGFSGGLCATPNPPPPLGNCAVFWVMNPEFFGGLSHLTSEVERLETYVREVPLIDGVQDVTLPGDPERRTLTERRANGIPLDEGNWKALVDLAKSLNVTAPHA
ncbi:Ldh family oxidoreductase [Schlesneria paludicola]|uniref:Ldh family oxidoreductase n=1 Tax=Schlesneria paludicola TaxID=360056 RepID=UPI0002FA0A17|nr:Ldh family oxidoreductase [Schlesneria paludicola]